MLIEVIEHVKAAGGSPKTLWGKLYGQEKVLATSAIARMNLLLHGVEDFKIVREDTLRDPAFFTGNRLAQFDCVIANPPFSLKNWGETEWASDKWGRNRLGGVPPKGYADWAWVQHMLTSARPKTGRVAVVLPQGALFRQGAEARIRKHILKADLVDAVIGLAPNLFYGTGLAACVLILRQHKQADEAGQGAVRQRREAVQARPQPEHAGTRARRASARTPTEVFDDIDGLAHVVDLDEIAGNDYNLNIPLYVAPADTGEKVTLAQALATWRPLTRRPRRPAPRWKPNWRSGDWGRVGMSTPRITQRELESYLWGAAVVLRGLIDAGDYKQYIFPLVFLKRISDVYDEEHAAAMEIYGDEELADLPENHRFAIPDGCHWDDIRSVTQQHRRHDPQGDARHRVGQPRHPARRVRRRRLGQQEPAARTRRSTT